MFPRPTALRLAGLMLEPPAETEIELGEIEQSAIKEAGNILSGAYLNALSDFMGLMLLPSPPSLAMDMSSAVLTTAYLQFGTDRDTSSASRPSSSCWSSTNGCADFSCCCRTWRRCTPFCAPSTSR